LFHPLTIAAILNACEKAVNALGGELFDRTRKTRVN
jgi:hypothetical protein